MPYYSELGIYTSPSSNVYVPGPYSNHSSILASNFTRPPTTISRNVRGFKPHLSTISENHSSLRRISSPKLLYHPSSQIKIPRPVKFNTADIDVSVNKYRFQKPSLTIDDQKKFSSPVKSPVESPRGSIEEKEAKPSTNITRDRATIRIQTIHKDLIPEQINNYKSWRDNFDFEEKKKIEEKKPRKTPGELLVEKFLIRSKEDKPKLERKKSKRASIKKGSGGIQKTPSFHDICTAITTNQINENLNPGQPVEIVRKQSRQLSTDDIIKELKRSSSDLANEILEMLSEEGSSDSNCKTRASVKKKKKQPSQKLSNNNENSVNEESNKKPGIFRRPTKKKIRRSSTNESLVNDDETELPKKETIRDISQVEIEKIKIKPKPIITGTVDVEEKPSLKAVIDEVEVEESPKPKKSSKFKFNVIVEEVEEEQKKPVRNWKRGSIKFGKTKTSGVKHLQISNVLKIAQKGYVGHILDDIKENDDVFESKNKNVVTKDEDNEKKSNKIVEKRRNTVKLVLKEKVDEENNEEQHPLLKKNLLESKSFSLDNAGKTDVNSNKKTEINSDIRKTKSSSALLSRKNSKFGEEVTDKNFWDQIRPRGSVYAKKPSIISRKNINLEPEEKPNEEKEKKLPSKRSLVNKANKDDPDLEVFVSPPEPEAKSESEEEEETSSGFVPLQSNRLSQFMNPFKKPEQYDECPIEIYARPKTIRKRHYPRPRHPPPPTTQESESSSDESTTSEEESSSDDEEEEDYDNSADGVNKVGASTSSNDSGFDSTVPGSRNNDCDVNCHKKCEKLTANLCGVNQKLIVEAIESVRKGSSEIRDSPTLNPAHNPTFSLESTSVVLEDYTKSSIFINFQKSGRITPPATTIPRFRKYCVDDFNFLKVLGKGSFGKVLLAELKNTEYYYAIKCLKKDVVLEDDDVECTLIERKVLALGTKHPYLCHLLCTFQTESHLFFVMEYLNGGDLMFHIQQSGRFPEARAKFYGAEIISGLKFLHNKGIVYRDLKLDNILLDFDGHVRIADFGMCKLQIFLDRMADTFCGTPDYMAPEIIKGLHYNQCVDWWSFGVLLYEMLIGQSPFSGCDEDELFWSICNEKPVIPRFLTTEASAILHLFLEKDANKRLGNKFCPSGDITDQPFFKEIQWDKLEARELESPFKPNLLHPLDTQYFDKTFTVERAKLTPIERNILQSMDQTQFQGFSYTNPNATDK